VGRDRYGSVCRSLKPARLRQSCAGEHVSCIAGPHRVRGARTEYRASKVALFDPKIEKFTEFALPQYTFPYRANFDKNGELWASTMSTDRVVRLDLKTNITVQYLMAAVDCARPLPPGRPMRIHNLYADGIGESHFRDMDIEMTEHGPDGSASGRLSASGIYFRTNTAGVVRLAPCHRRASILTRANKITGEIILIEDVHGKGHLSEVVGKMRRSVMIPID
jgi:hypothetical protein